MQFAAIDIGTNAARLLIGEVAHEGKSSFVKKISYTRIPLRLGESVFSTGEISAQKQEEFIKTIKAFSLIADIFNVTELKACATSAMREANNGSEVQQKIKDETGVTIDIISGQEEAELIFSTFFLMNIDRTLPFVVVDVGGGSTEVSVFENGERVAAKSFQLGTLRLLQDKTDESIWDEIHDWLIKHLDMSIVHEIYATGGNINKVHKLLGAGYMEPISLEEISSLRDELNSLTINERITNYQLKPDRADVIVPALDIYLYILNELDCSEVVVPKIGLADGMIYTMDLKHRGGL
ncbi:MAG: exopolyphosphatase/guanosine-5'-triphosphate,3'-diphosphate pyrophosphatase [Flavobacteriaceae bacterium]|jgi:exopolyphosphatase/guanosine-5'-triphosphate,3'-diphosphate pyrophosphatase